MYGRTPFGKEGRMDYVLELSNIYKYYGSLAANKDVSLKVKKGSTCMACLACVGACSEAFYKVFDPDKACLQIVEKKAVRPIACPQCGKCAEACPEGAITQNPKGVYMINKKKCTGCGACAKACPFGLIVKTEGNPASKCIACGICAKACPMDVLEVVDE